MDSIRATPMQYPTIGLLSDKLKELEDYVKRSYAEYGVDAGTALNLLGIPAVQQTAERIAYGEPLTTGKGMTTQVRPEVMEAAMTLLPAVGTTAKGAEKAAMAAGRAGERYAEKVVPQIMERGGMPASLLGDLSTQTVSPLTVYHGSPAKFSKFDPTKIGSGEGAQAYGYGHYVAESPDVARRYQMGLTQAKGEEVLYKNKPLTDLYSQIENKSMKLSGKAADIENQKLQLVEHMMLDKPPQELIPYAKETGFYQSVIDWLEKDVAKNTQIPGAFYEIDLPDEQIARMIDYDKKFVDQSKEVQDLIKNALELRKSQTGGYGLFDPLEQSSIKDLIGTIGEERLRQSGIPGIRYLDEGSRGVGEGTSNFVVFPGGEDLLTIQKRNNEPVGLLSAPAEKPMESLLDTSYRMTHTAPNREFGATLDDLTGGGQMYPADVYSPKGYQYYGAGMSYDKKAFDIANKFKGKPDAMVEIYRAVPKGVSDEINPGDWVTLTKEYAIDHGDANLQDGYKIIKKKVKASDIYTNADSIHEWGYDPN